MKKLALSILSFSILVATASAQPPSTRSTSASQTYHGIEVPDPYAWLENAKSSEVKAWIEAQNAYAEAELSRYPAREALAQRIGELALTGPNQTSPQLAKSSLFFMKDTPPAAQPVLVYQSWPQGKQTVLVNTNTEQNPSAISDFWPSPSGRYVAYSTAVGGNELATIFFVETATGKKLSDVLTLAGGGTTPPSLVWDPDERGVTYVRLPADSLFSASLYHHQLGSEATTDSPVYGQGLSPVAEWELTSSESGRHQAALVHKGDGAPTLIAIHRADGWGQVLSESYDIRGGGRWLGEHLLVVSYQGAPRGKILAVKPDGSAATLLPQGAWAVKDVYPIKGGLLVARVWGPQQKLEHYNTSGKLLRTVALPPHISLGTIASSSQSSQALITYRGWTIPERWISYQAQNGDLTTLFEQKPGGDYQHVTVSQLEATSKDGTMIPISVLHHKDIQPGRPHPTILYGYGGFGVILGPSFLGPNLAWIERGGVYAVANIRGGGEYGEPWHQQGMKTYKQNGFDDFYSAALALEKAGWTNPQHLGIMGGSNGGLLVGATLVQHPKSFGAVVGLVGVMDALGHQRFANGVYNIPEYGSTEKLEEFHALRAYSPYQNTLSAPYPPVLLQTGENDLRVAPWQSRKFGAMLQHQTTSTNPILIVTQTNAGHGQGASFSQKVGKSALALTFLAQHLGLAEKPLP